MLGPFVSVFGFESGPSRCVDLVLSSGNGSREALQHGFHSRRRPSDIFFCQMLSDSRSVAKRKREKTNAARLPPGPWVQTGATHACVLQSREDIRNVFAHKSKRVDLLGKLNFRSCKAAVVSALRIVRGHWGILSFLPIPKCKTGQLIELGVRSKESQCAELPATFEAHFPTIPHR